MAHEALLRRGCYDNPGDGDRKPHDHGRGAISTSGQRSVDVIPLPPLIPRRAAGRLPTILSRTTHT